MKLAAIEAMWETEPAPAAFTAFGFPDQATAQERTTRSRCRALMGLIATRSLDTRDPGHPDELVERAEAPHPRRA